MKNQAKRSRGGFRTRKRSRAGFTLMETALATTVMMVALMTASAATLRMHSLRQQNRERVVAQNALRSVVEQVHAVSARARAEADEVTSWAELMVEAFAGGGDIGTTFTVPELTPRADDMPIGSIAVFTDETATDAVIGFDLGMPRDLNGDNAANDTDVTDDARILPVMVTVTWLGVTGTNTMTHAFYVLGY